MTAVLEVGPRTVRGPSSCARAEAAVEAVDDPLVVVDGEVVEVSALWRDVLAAAAAPHDTAVLVVPSWWPAARITVLDAVAGEVFTDHDVQQRDSLFPESAAVLEVADELLRWRPPGGHPVILARAGADLTALLGAVTAVTVDLPAGVAPLPAALLRSLTERGVAVTHASAERRPTVASERSVPAPVPRWRRSRTIVVVSGAAAAVTVAAAAALAAPPAPQFATVVEGRMSVRVPAGWRVERITGGPGSDRLRAAAPGGLPALHLTHSVGPPPRDLAALADVLGGAVESAEPGVFTPPAAHSRFGRPAVTYREQRAQSTTDWTVVVDGDVRIAVGCQTAAGRADQTAADDTAAACEEAVRSARAVR